MLIMMNDSFETLGSIIWYERNFNISPQTIQNNSLQVHMHIILELIQVIPLNVKYFIHGYFSFYSSGLVQESSSKMSPTTESQRRKQQQIPYTQKGQVSTPSVYLTSRKLQ